MRTIRRLRSARTAIALGLVALTLNIAALVLLAAANQTAPQIVRIAALLPTVAVGMLVAVRRPGNLASIQDDLAATVEDAFEPTHVSVWLAGRS